MDIFFMLSSIILKLQFQVSRTKPLGTMCVFSYGTSLERTNFCGDAQKASVRFVKIDLVALFSFDTNVDFFSA